MTKHYLAASWRASLDLPAPVAPRMTTIGTESAATSPAMGFCNVHIHIYIPILRIQVQYICNQLFKRLAQYYLPFFFSTTLIMYR